MVAVNGVTGDGQDLTAAHGAMHNDLLVHDKRILVITLAELMNVRGGRRIR